MIKNWNTVTSYPSILFASSTSPINLSQGHYFILFFFSLDAEDSNGGHHVCMTGGFTLLIGQCLHHFEYTHCLCLPHIDLIVLSFPKLLGIPYHTSRKSSKRTSDKYLDFCMLFVFQIYHIFNYLCVHVSVWAGVDVGGAELWSSIRPVLISELSPKLPCLHFGNLPSLLSTRK